MMTLHCKNFVGNQLSASGAKKFRGVNPATRANLDGEFVEATTQEVDAAFNAAHAAFPEYRAKSPDQIAQFLDNIGVEILARGDALIQRANAETALPEARLIGERMRTVNTLKMFGELIREGSWLDARIDLAIPERKPLPKPDVRRMLIPVGPVVVFGASNFPLAISVAGTDTASALAAGNPVVVKAHPAHPGTSELIATAIRRAVEKSQMPAGVFSMLHGTSNDVGLAMARHEHARAIAFTGSLRGGRAIFDAACARPVPIPCFAEMGSINPVFVLPGALRERGAEIAAGLVQSLTLSVGQFCTNPGIVVGLRESLQPFLENTSKLAAQAAPATMLHAGIAESYWRGVERLRGTKNVAAAAGNPRGDINQASAAVFETDSATFLSDKTLHDENFGPSTIFVKCDSVADFAKILETLEGQLAITVHGNADDLREFKPFLAAAADRTGRLIVNGFPTGLEICPSLVHGGPYPATTDPRTTSMGQAAILRFARPVCYQNFPQELLPVELQNENTRKIWRMIDGKLTKEDA